MALSSQFSFLSPVGQLIGHNPLTFMVLANGIMFSTIEPGGVKATFVNTSRERPALPELAETIRQFQNAPSFLTAELMLNEFVKCGVGTPLDTDTESKAQVHSFNHVLRQAASLVLSGLKTKAERTVEEGILRGLAKNIWLNFSYAARVEESKRQGLSSVRNPYLEGNELRKDIEDDMNRFGQLDDEFIVELLESRRIAEHDAEVRRKGIYEAALARGESLLPGSPPTADDYTRAIAWVESKKTVQWGKLDLQPTWSIRRNRKPALPLALTCLALGGMALTRYYPIPRIGTLR
jgi:hypothetical protein